jgi:hypothetical protein
MRFHILRVVFLLFHIFYLKCACLGKFKYSLCPQYGYIVRKGDADFLPVLVEHCVVPWFACTLLPA